MTKALITKEDVIKRISTVWDTFQNISSFEDIERVFLRGQGLSAHTYRTYRQAIKKFYGFTNGKHPLQVTAADIEAFYDFRSKEVDLNTAYLDIRGLKKYFEGVKPHIPFFKSPFDDMPEKLIKKLNKTKSGNRTKKALTQNEIKALLQWLSLKTDVRGMEDYAIVFMLVTSGLRADELCQLRWKDIECFERKWTAVFIGKGGKVAEQELYSPAVEATKKYFIKAFKHDPRSDDSLFWTIQVYKGDTPRPMPYHTLWRRVKSVGETAMNQGIIKRKLDFTPHLFRRSYATNLYRMGMKIKAIQEKTRHTNINTLIKHYIHDDEIASPYIDKILI